MLLSYFQSNTCFKIIDKIYLKSTKRTNSTCLLLYIYFLSLKVRRSSLNYSCSVSKIIYDWYFSWLLLHAWVGTVFLKVFYIYKVIFKIKSSLSMTETSTPLLWIFYFMENKWKRSLRQISLSHSAHLWAFFLHSP